MNAMSPADDLFGSLLHASQVATGWAIVMNLISLACSILVVVSLWRIFQKAGRPGWAAIVPFYNLWVLHDMLYGQGAQMFFLLIPFFNLYWMFKYNIDLAAHFGKTAGFGVGMTLLGVVFYPMLGFGNEQYR